MARSRRRFRERMWEDDWRDARRWLVIWCQRIWWWLKHDIRYPHRAGMFHPAWLTAWFFGITGLVLTLFLFWGGERWMPQRQALAARTPVTTIPIWRPASPNDIDTVLYQPVEEPRRHQYAVILPKINEAIVSAPVRRQPPIESPSLTQPKTAPPALDLQWHWYRAVASKSEPAVNPYVVSAVTHQPIVHTTERTSVGFEHADGWKIAASKPIPVAVGESLTSRASRPILDLPFQWSDDLVDWPAQNEIHLAVEWWFPDHACRERLPWQVRLRNLSSGPVAGARCGIPVSQDWTLTEVVRNPTIGTDGACWSVNDVAARSDELWTAWLQSRRPGEQRVTAWIEGWTAVAASTQISIPETPEVPVSRRERPVELPDPQESHPVQPVVVTQIEPMREPARRSAPEHSDAPVVARLEGTATLTEAIPVGDYRVLRIEAKNVGSTPLHDVKIIAELPTQTGHKHGNIVELKVGRMSVGESYPTVLYLKGEKVGEGTCRIRFLAGNADDVARSVLAKVIAEPTKPSAKPIPPTLAQEPCWCAQQ